MSTLPQEAPRVTSPAEANNLMPSAVAPALGKVAIEGETGAPVVPEPGDIQKPEFSTTAIKKMYLELYPGIDQRTNKPWAQIFYEGDHRAGRLGGPRTDGAVNDELMNRAMKYHRYLQSHQTPPSNQQHSVQPHSTGQQTARVSSPTPAEAQPIKKPQAPAASRNDASASLPANQSPRTQHNQDVLSPQEKAAKMKVVRGMAAGFDALIEERKGNGTPASDLVREFDTTGKPVRRIVGEKSQSAGTPQHSYSTEELVPLGSLDDLEIGDPNEQIVSETSQNRAAMPVAEANEVISHPANSHTTGAHQLPAKVGTTFVLKNAPLPPVIPPRSPRGLRGILARFRRDVDQSLAGVRNFIDLSGLNWRNPLKGVDVRKATHTAKHHAGKYTALAGTHVNEARHALGAGWKELRRLNFGDAINDTKTAWTQGKERRSDTAESYDLHDAVYKGMVRALSAKNPSDVLPRLGLGGVRLDRRLIDNINSVIIERLGQDENYTHTLENARRLFHIDPLFLVYLALNQLPANTRRWNIHDNAFFEKASEAEKNQLAGLVGEALTDATLDRIHHKEQSIKTRYKRDRDQINYERQLRNQTSR